MDQKKNSGDKKGISDEDSNDDSLIDIIDDLSNEKNTRSNYFYNKKIKQTEQDQIFKKQYNSIGKASSDLFKNCIIYINGYTKPSRLQLHELIVLHGGKFLHHMSAKGNVTHIIATSLPLKKKLEFKNYKVLKPEWITESIKQKKILPWQDFSIVSDLDQQQQKIFIPQQQQNQLPNCKDPNYLKDYFSHSRLHHLSEWKSSLRQDFLNFYKIKSKPEMITSQSNFKILHIDFDCFFATVAFIHRDLSKFSNLNFDKDPIVVCHGSKNSDIASCNYVARKFGIKNGMWVSQTENFLPKDIKLTVLPYNFNQIENASKQFYSILHNLNIFYYVLPVSIDEAICVLMENELDNDIMDEKQLCEMIRQKIKTQTNGCTISIGMANSLVLARLALRKAKPNGYFICSNQEEDDDDDYTDNDFWSFFKIDDLPGVGRSTVQKIKETFKKIENLNDLRKLTTLDTLKNCLGNKLGTKIYLGIHGKDDEESLKIIYNPFEIFERKSISIEVNWGIRFDKIEEIDNFFNVCTKYLIEKLSCFDKLVSQITLKLMKRSEGAPIDPQKFMGMGKCDPFTTSSRLGIPTNDFGIIATELKHLYRTLPVPPKELRGVSIQFTRLTNTEENDKSSQKGLNVFFNQVVSPIDKTKESDKNVMVPNEYNTIRKKYKRLKLSPVKEKQTEIKINSKDSYKEQFLQELPTQIRNVVKNDILISERVNETKVGKMREEIERRNDAVKDINSHFFNKDSIFIPTKFQGETNYKIICSMVTNWVQESIKTDGPHETDLKIFETYLNKLCDSNRTHLALRLAQLISQKLNLMASKYETEEGFVEWDNILLRVIIPLMNRNKHTFQSERKLDLEFNL